MDEKRMQAIVAAYGGDPARWPAGTRGDNAPAVDLAREQALDGWLDQLPAMAPSPGLAARITARAARTQQKRRFGLWLPAGAWRWLAPNAAGMAAALAAGFIIAQAAQPSDMLDTAELVLRLDSTAPLTEDWDL
ncbi:MAG: hypothetical protein Tsb0016_17240 [Sphingomonadales bacterium]